METKKLVHDAVQRGFEQLEEVDLSSDEYKTCVEGLTELVDREIEIRKVEADAEFKTKQAKDEKVDRIVKNVLTGVSIVGGFGLTIWGSLKSWKFEETGIVSNGPGKEFMKKLFHMK